MNFLSEYEQLLRPGIFLGLLIILAGAEFLFPLAKRKCSRPLQWFTNLSIVVLDSIALKLLFPLLAVGIAQYATNNHIGLFNLIDLNYYVVVILSLLLLDLLIYAQHVLMHKVPLLWRLHRMHHTEIGLDVTSAVRFHPIEIILSMLIKMLFVLILGIPVGAVILFEILLNGLALFNHSNLKLPATLEKFLRLFIITPEIHWVHHSQIVCETNSNYGFNLCFWDKIFSTYNDHPTLSYQKMEQGLSEFGLEKPISLPELLVSPFKDYSNQKE